MRLILFVLSMLVIFSSNCFAEIRVSRDMYGNISSKSSNFVIPYDDKFNLSLYFSGKMETIEYQKQKIPSPSFFIIMRLEPKSNSIEGLQEIHFIDRSFSYWTSDTGRWLTSVRARLKDGNDGEIAYYKRSGEYSVYTSGDSISVQQEYGSYYRPAQMIFSFYGSSPDTTNRVTALNQIDSSNEVLFGACVTNAIALNKTIKFSIPYTTEGYKNFDSYTQEERENLPRIEITIPQYVISEWQQLVQFQPIGAPPKLDTVTIKNSVLDSPLINSKKNNYFNYKR